MSRIANRIYQNHQVSFQICSWMKQKIRNTAMLRNVLLQHNFHINGNDKYIDMKNKNKQSKIGIKLIKNIGKLKNIDKQRNTPQKKPLQHKPFKHHPPKIQIIPIQSFPRSTSYPLHTQPLHTQLQNIPLMTTYNKNSQPQLNPCYKKLKHKKCISKQTISTYNDKLCQTKKILQTCPNQDIANSNPLSQTKKINQKVQEYIPYDAISNNISNNQLTQQFQNIKSQIKKTVSILKFKQIQSILLTKNDLYLNEKLQNTLIINDLSRVGNIQSAPYDSNSFSLSFVDLVSNNKMFLEDFGDNYQNGILTLEMEIQMEMNKTLQKNL